jgi:hypothetical protein
MEKEEETQYKFIELARKTANQEKDFRRFEVPA